jgi:PAS domain S-box-containing protein
MQDAPACPAASAQEVSYRQLYLQMPLPCWVYDRRTMVFLDANPAAERLYGYSRAELLAMEIYAICLPAEAERLRAVLAARAAGEPASPQSDWIHRTRDGVELAVRVKAADIDWAGREARIVFATDFSEQRAAQTEIKLLYECLETADDMIVVTRADADAHGNRPIVYVNAAMERRTGYARTELLGRDARLLQGQGTDPAARQCIREALASWRPVRVELVNYTRSGEPYWAEMTISPVADERGCHRYWFSVERDITERKRSEQALVARRDELEAHVSVRTQELQRTVRELEFFNRAVAHDLQNPLNGVRGFSELMEMKHGRTLGDDARRMLGLVRRSADRMHQIIQDLLSLGRLQRMVLRPVQLDLAALCQPLVSALHTRQPQRQVEWVLPAGVTVYADLQLLGVVFENLLGNAWKYSANVPAARIELSARPCAAGLVLTVADNGVGFDAAAAQALFTPFQRLHAQAEFEGTGIGLASVAQALERMQGWAWADSPPGQGARLHVFLPTRVVASSDAVATHDLQHA